MIKHEAGYDPEALDWEFLYFDGDPLRRVSLDADGNGPGGAQACSLRRQP